MGKTIAERDLIDARIRLKNLTTFPSLVKAVDEYMSSGIRAEDIIRAAMRSASSIGFREAQEELS